MLGSGRIVALSLVHKRGRRRGRARHDWRASVVVIVVVIFGEEEIVGFLSRLVVVIVGAVVLIASHRRVASRRERRRLVIVIAAGAVVLILVKAHAARHERGSEILETHCGLRKGRRRRRGRRCAITGRGRLLLRRGQFPGGRQQRAGRGAQRLGLRNQRAYLRSLRVGRGLRLGRCRLGEERHILESLGVELEETMTFQSDHLYKNEIRKENGNDSAGTQ